MSYTLLAADDSATIRRVIELTFADRDITVVTVGDGDAAIASLDSARPDIVLADILMPGRSGYEVARHIRDTAGLSHIPVLLLAGAFDSVDGAMAASLGCAGILTKPLDPQLVIRRVSELLDARAADTESPAEVPDVVAPSDHPVPAPVALSDIEMSEWAMAIPVAGPPEVPAAVAEAPPPTAPAEPTPSIAALLMALPGSPAPVSLPPGPSEPPAPSAPRDHEVEAYFEELDEKLTGRVRAEHPPLHIVEPTAAVPEREMVAESSEPFGGVSGSDDGGAAPARPSLVDAFSALLAAEQATPGRPAVSSRAAQEPLTVPASDDILERVTRRALDRLSDDTLRAMVERVVSETAERLIREEIERIKSNIK